MVRKHKVKNGSGVGQQQTSPILEALDKFPFI